MYIIKHVSDWLITLKIIPNFFGNFYVVIKG